MNAWIESLPTWAMLLLIVVIYGGFHFAQIGARSWGQRHNGKWLERDGKPLPYAGTLGGLLLVAVGLPMAYYFLYTPYHAIETQAPDVTYSMKGAMLAVLLLGMGIFLILGNNWYVANYDRLKAMPREEMRKHWLFKFFVVIVVVLLAGSNYAINRYLEAHGYEVTHGFETDKADYAPQ